MNTDVGVLPEAEAMVYIAAVPGGVEHDDGSVKGRKLKQSRTVIAYVHICLPHDVIELGYESDTDLPVVLLHPAGVFPLRVGVPQHSVWDVGELRKDLAVVWKGTHRLRGD